MAGLGSLQSAYNLGYTDTLEEIQNFIHQQQIAFRNDDFDKSRCSYATGIQDALAATKTAAKNMTPHNVNFPAYNSTSISHNAAYDVGCHDALTNIQFVVTQYANDAQRGKLDETRYSYFAGKQCALAIIEREIANRFHALE